MSKPAWNERKYRVRIARYENLEGDWEWIIIAEYTMNICEILNYMLKIISMHDDAESVGDTIESLEWKENDILYGLVVEDPDAGCRYH